MNGRGNRSNRSNISAEEAGRILNVRPQAIREHIKRGSGLYSQLGTAEKRGKQYYYIIFRERVERFKKEYCE